MKTYHIRELDNRIQGRLALVTGARYWPLVSILIRSKQLTSENLPVEASAQLLRERWPKKVVMSFCTATQAWFVLHGTRP